MGNSKKPLPDDQENDGTPDNEQAQAQAPARSGKDLDGDGVPDDESRIQSGPVIINH